MKPGTKPKPTKVKQLKGTLRKCRTFADELTFGGLNQKPSAPEFLGVFGRMEWDRVVSQIYGSGVLSEVDISMLTAYCLEMQDYFEDKDTVKKEGKYSRLRNKAGEEYLALHPAVNSGNKHLANAKSLAAEFGFTPSSRTRISVGKAKEEDPSKVQLLKLMKGG